MGYWLPRNISWQRVNIFNVEMRIAFFFLEREFVLLLFFYFIIFNCPYFFVCRLIVTNTVRGGPS